MCFFSIYLRSDLKTDDRKSPYCKTSASNWVKLTSKIGSQVFAEKIALLTKRTTYFPSLVINFSQLVVNLKCLSYILLICSKTNRSVEALGKRSCSRN